jgi:exopolysaccharide biosynthesis polyprenyl glycosylphosphotransferase
VQEQVQASGPTVISSKKLLRSASVGRTIPGLGTHRLQPRQKQSKSTTVANRFRLRALESPLDGAESKMGRYPEFSFPNTAPQRRVQLIGDTCGNLLLAAISFAVVHVVTIAHSWDANGMRIASNVIARHLLASDLGLMLVWGVLVTLFRQLFDHAELSSEVRRSEWSMEIEAVTFTTLIIALAVSLSGIGLATPAMLFGIALVNLAGSFARLSWKHRASHSTCSTAKGAKNVLIAGAGEVGQEIANYLANHPEHLRIVKGFLDENPELDTRILGRSDDLAEIARAEFIDEIILAIAGNRELARTVIIEALRNHLDVRVAAERYETYGAEGLDRRPILPLHEEPIPEFGLLAKRALDVGLAALALIILAPLLALIAAAIRVDSSGPVLYRAPRIGKKGLKFLCCKFRTMVVDADRVKKALLDFNERTGPIFKIEHDPRITRVGHFLRRYSLDELPQLWNVLLGEMSLVGPRPHPLDDYQRYGLQHLRRLDVTPGITGLWQVTARRDPSFYKNMELDLEYIDQWSLWEDLKILVRTLRVVVAGTGV